MAVERKTKSRRKLDEVGEKPTKEEYAVAKFLRFNVPPREGRLARMTVQCFFANKAVDALMESKWSASKQKKEPLFTNRASCVAFCNRLLQKGLFHRAEKVVKCKDRDKTKKKKKLKEGEKEEESAEETLRERKKKDKKGKKDGNTDKADEDNEDAEKKEDKNEKKEEKKTEKEEEKKKKEKKLKVNMHEDQRFVDGEEIYVWIYDPIPFKTFVIGLLMVFGAIGLCLFPLWPEEVRIGVYYLSLAAAGFVGFILSLVVVRLVLFCLVWVTTFGKHHFWFLPNLTEDVGFFDSFKPLYKHDIMGKDSGKGDKSKDKKGKEVKEKSKTNEEETKTEIEKDDNSGSDKSENGEFELVNKDELAEGENGEENGEENEEEMDGEMEDEEDQDFDEEESEEDTQKDKKTK